MDTFRNGYNSTTGSVRYSDVSQHVKDERSKRMCGKNNPMYGTSRNGKDNPFYNKNHTEESVLRIKIARAKQVISPEVLENL